MSNEPSATQADLPLDPTALGRAFIDYVTDAAQRTVLYADIRRQRGDQYRKHLAETAPNVLHFAAELVMSGAELARPVNYALARIVPPPDQPVDPAKRPFIVVDPRAGHGPGIGGFKPDSEIGAAMRAGHPCYFIGFLPDPVPGQTIEDVIHAEAAFVRRVGELHGTHNGKPAVIGNCQAGWQVLMTAALWPDLFGPIIVAGTPLSYWAGDNPMRYAGGLLGGSWLTALTSDLGAGRFDGAWLVQNFENLDPANTLWTKQYNVYAKVDTEGPRYLDFEKYWGGHVFLNDVEMQYIVDNLFIGNKLATAELITSDGMRVDLRNIRSPIVVFCSYRDNITPPAQALGWVTDLYRNEDDLVSHDQTIVYATHDSIGHLGIFVSSSVGRKEHREFANSIDLIDLLPPGLYQATVDEQPQADAAQYVDDKYLMSIHRRDIEDVRAIVKSDLASERRFNAAARLSEINLGLYRAFVQPLVKALATPYSAHWMQLLHPLRLSFEWWSSEHPLADTVEEAAQKIKAERAAVSADNPFLQWEKQASDAIEHALDRYRDHRDELYRIGFETIFGSPALQALAGSMAHPEQPARPRPGDSPEHRAFVAQEKAHRHASISHGGLLEAGIRTIFYVLRQRGVTNSRHFQYAIELHHPTSVSVKDMPSFRQIIRQQALLISEDPDASIATLPTLLREAAPEDIRAVAHSIEQLVNHEGDLSAEEACTLAAMLDLFERSAQAKESASAPGSPMPSPKPAPTGRATTIRREASPIKVVSPRKNGAVSRRTSKERK
ncbi:3-hydroxyalkanoate synthetase [Bordetella sputigena]|uniref:DUF3141 domain-containing protein n=1 Tax=Bordetella sputigena TaxID=1416810 RepID=UPI0039EEC8AF